MIRTFASDRRLSKDITRTGWAKIYAGMEHRSRCIVGRSVDAEVWEKGGR